MDITHLIIDSQLKKFVWIVPSIVVMLSLLLGPLVVTESVFAEEKIPTKYVSDRLLIKFKKDISNSEKDKALKDNGASVLAEIKQIDVKLIKIPEHALEKVQAAFAKNSKVEFVEKDYIFEPVDIPNDPNYPNQWHLPAINAPSAWDITTGSSIPIAILDTGVDPNHPDLKNKLTLGYNFYNNNNDWTDVCGHGTAVAGSAAAISNNGIGVTGVAWNNPIIPIKITDSNCYGYYSSMINGIVYAADNGARVANISFQIFNGAALNSAAQYMNAHGGWVVAAAGNTGVFENYSENPYIISVGATSSNGLVTSFSSYGPFVDFAAPGSSVYTTKNGGTYGYASGTSFASPIVAGVVGLIISNNPSMNSQQVYDALKNSAVDKGTTGRDNYYGWGLVNAYGAVTQNSPPPPIDSTPPTVTITNPENGASLSGPFTVTVESSDNVAINKVELHIDGAYHGQKTTVPYNFVLDADTMSEGTHQIKAISIDSSGNSNFDTITVTVVRNVSDDVPPNVSITNPSNGATISGMTNVNVDATDNVALSLVQFYVNGVLKDQKSSSPYSFSVDTKNLPSGTNILKAKATDSSNNFNEDTINVLVEEITLPSSISITNPSNGATVNGRVKITAVPSNFATTPSVKFFIDGLLKSTDTTLPYEYLWNTKGQSAGSHTITAQGSDSKGNTASTSISVSIPEKASGKNSSESPGNGKKSQEVELDSSMDDKSLEIFQTFLVESTEQEEKIISAEAPIFEPISPLEIAEGETQEIQIVTEESDVDDFTFPANENTGIPEFVLLDDNGDGTATLTISPKEGDVGVYDIVIIAADESDPPLLNSITVMLTVTNTNQAPEISLIESAIVNEGLEISVPFFVTDPDGDLLSFSAQGLPEFATLVINEDTFSGSLEISPDFGDTGEFTMSLTVSDSGDPQLTDSKEFVLTVLESTPSSIILHLQNQKSSLGTEDFSNLGQKVSYAAQLHKYLVGATKQERSDFQDAFHDYINEAKGILEIGQGVEKKMISQEVLKTQLKLDGVLEKLNKQEENENKAKDAMLLIEKRKELADIISQLVSVEHFIKTSPEKEKLIEELTTKKLDLMKEVKVKEAKQSNVDLTDDDVKQIEQNVEQSSQPASTGQDNGDSKTNNGQGNSGNSNNGNKGSSSSDKGNNGNKGGNDKSKK